MTDTSIRAITKDLVSVQSDTGTSMESAMAEKIAEYFRQDEYFSANPEVWGVTDTGDFLGRPLVWALKKGTTSKTVILSGHYDAVEIECYGSLKPFALEPDRLAEEALNFAGADSLLKEDLAQGDWMMGRGSADMKGGLAIGINKVLSHSENSATGILFVAVCDEENASAGSRSAVPFMAELKERFGLDYVVSLILEPQFDTAESGKDKFLVYNGSIGKMLPMIVVRGRNAHCGEPLKGINAAHIIAEIAQRIDLNVDLTTSDLGMCAQVPTVQIMRDLKTTYDVSLPEYGALCVNLLFLGSGSAEAILKKLEEICGEAVQAFMAKYERAFEFTADNGLITQADSRRGPIEILTLSQLEENVRKNNKNFDGLKSSLENKLLEDINSGRATLQTASTQYIQAMIEASGDDEPAIVIGIAPPYYPCVCNTYLGDEYLYFTEIMKNYLKESAGMTLTVVPYFTGIGDASYMSCMDTEKEKNAAKNLTLPESCYKIPVEAAAKLSAPCFYLGPRCREIHRWGERVNLRDLERYVPDLIDKIVEKA